MSMTPPVSRPRPAEAKSLPEQPGQRLVAGAAPGSREAEVGERGLGGHAAAGRAHEEAALDEEGLVDVLDGLGLLPHADGQRREPDRSAPEALADGGEDGPVDLVE